MILISVKSEVMDVKRQYEKEKDAEKYLKFVKDFHDKSRYQRMGPRPEMRGKNWREAINWDDRMKTCIPLSIEIINTEANQLNLQLK